MPRDPDVHTEVFYHGLNRFISICMSMGHQNPTQGLFSNQIGSLQGDVNYRSAPGKPRNSFRG
jgi:hypothetical protein